VTASLRKLLLVAGVLLKSPFWWAYLAYMGFGICTMHTPWWVKVLGMLGVYVMGVVMVCAQVRMTVRRRPW
jgi:hypothetical protein